VVKFKFGVDDKWLVFDMVTNNTCTIYLFDGQDFNKLDLESEETISKLGSCFFTEIRDKFIEILSNIETYKTIEYAGANIIPLVNLSDPHSSLSVTPLIDGYFELNLLDFSHQFYPILIFDTHDKNRFLQALKSSNLNH